MKHKQLALTTIAAASQIGRLQTLDDQGNPVCAIGWLFKAAEPLLPEDFKAPVHENDVDEDDPNEDPYRVVEGFYDLTDKEVEALYEANDSYRYIDSSEERRRAVLQYISSLEEK